MKKNKNTPWTCFNSDPDLISPDELHRIEFSYMEEIAMGSPLLGLCLLIDKSGKQYKISDRCGSPIVWSKNNYMVAFPYWHDDLSQRLAILNLKDKSVSVFAQKFRVLQLKLFGNRYVSGIDSPIHNTEDVYFDAFDENILQEYKIQPI